MTVIEFLKDNILRLDGGMGTMIQASGLAPGELPESWNLKHGDIIKNIHKAYFDAGANVVNTNTFGANGLKMSSEELKATVTAAVRIAEEAAAESVGRQPKFVALDLGPTGKMLKPLGDLDFEEAVRIYSEICSIGAECGADLIFIETMSDSYEAKAALLAAKESCNLPVFVSCAFGEDGKLMTGADAKAMVATLEGLGADAIGVNCSLGPKKLAPVVEEFLKYASVPVIVKPNAGLPRVKEGVTVYDLTPEEFAIESAELISLGAKIAGGCCGTTPEYIKALGAKIDGISPVEITKKNHTLVSSYTHGVEIGDKPILIGERINPTGKPRFKDALRRRDMGYILKEGIAQEESGADVLDVNVGLPEIDEAEMLVSAVMELQTVLDLPLQIDTSNTAAMEAALRVYNGKAMINSVNGKEESMKAVFPLAKKYGGLVVALTLDESGLPEKAEQRLAIARKILFEAEKYGIDKKDIIFDPLAMAISADKNAARETLRAVKLICEELGCHTSLGVSNVSFGLPRRDIINGAYFTLALQNGLSAAIMNPYSDEMMKAYHSYLALMGLDENCAEYIDFASNLSESVVAPAQTGAESKPAEEFASLLEKAIVKGLKDDAARLTSEMLNSTSALKIVDEHIIPALDIVGVGFEKKTVYLPGLLMSAEAAKAAFEVIKERMSGNDSDAPPKCRVVIATVKGDIHDIGRLLR